MAEVDERLGHVVNRVAMEVIVGDAVIQALNEQANCYRRLTKLAAMQRDHVQQNNIDALLEVLGSRQKVLDDISRLERTLAPVKRQWRGFLQGLGPDERATAERLLDEMRRLLDQLAAADQHDALVLQQRKLNLGRQIREASAAKQVNRAYAAAAYGSRPAHTDVQR